jgi:hypothetical protein
VQCGVAVESRCGGVGQGVSAVRFRDKNSAEGSGSAVEARSGAGAT